MIEIQRNDDYSERADRSGDSLPCVICGCSVNNPKHWIRVFTGDRAVFESEIKDLSPSADMGYFPIGDRCLYLCRCKLVLGC